MYLKLAALIMGAAFSLQPTKRLACIGDSTTHPNLAVVNWVDQVNAGLGGRWYVDQHGIPGDGTAHMAARHYTDIIGAGYGTYGYGYVVILGGINDINLSGMTGAAVWANLKGLADTDLSAGVVPIFITTLAAGGYSGWSSAKQTQLDALNASIRSYVSSHSLPWVDGYALLGDPAAPTHLLAAYDSGDGIHPSQAGNDRLAVAVLSVIPR